MSVDVIPAEDGVAVLVAGVGPRDGIEEALAAQMAECHEAALACLANARRQDLPESARTAELRTGARLMSLFTQQLTALERHRTHLRQEREAAAEAGRDAELHRRFAEQDAEREAEEALIYPDRHARRLAARAALDAPKTDEAIFERLAQRFERRLKGQGDEADGGAQPAPTPQSLGAAVPTPTADSEAPLNRQQRRAMERKRARRIKKRN